MPNKKGENNVSACHLFDFMKKWKEEGKIRRIAFSYHDDAEHLDQSFQDSMD